MGGSDISDSSDDDLDLMETVQSCFKHMTVPTKQNYNRSHININELVNQQVDTSDNSDCENIFEPDNVFKYYDTKTSSIERKLDRYMRMFKKQSKKIKCLEKIFFKKKKTVFKPVSVTTPEGRQYSCSFCGISSKSWGKGCAHIAEFHTGKKMICNYQNCTFETYNPDSLNKHRKKHVN